MKLTTEKIITKGIEAFVNELSTQNKIRFDVLVEEYSKRYGTNNIDIIKLISYNEVIEK